MYRHLKNKIIAGSILLAAFACDNDEFKNDSTLTASNPTVSVDAPFGSNVNFIEKDTTFEFTVTLSEPQIVDVAVYVNVNAGGSATEGEDFALGTNRIVIPAFRTSAKGSIAFSDDAAVEPAESVTITVGDSRTANATLTPVQFSFTVANADVPPPSTVEFTLSWVFASEDLANTDACDNDVDLTLQTQGTDPYDDDLLGYAASSTSCPEHGTLTVDDMVDGEVYDVWVFFYGDVDYGDLSGVTVTVDFERNDSDFAGSIEIADVFDSRDASAGALIGTIERNGDVLTFKDADGAVVSEGRVSGIKKITNVKKPI
jgi:hypothetical protein